MLIEPFEPPKISIEFEETNILKLWKRYSDEIDYEINRKKFCLNCEKEFDFYERKEINP